MSTTTPSYPQSLMQNPKMEPIDPHMPPAYNQQQQLPPLPQISGDADIMLDIYTHKSIQFPGMDLPENPEYGNTDRLAFIGQKAYELFATDALFKKQPPLDADSLKAAVVAVGDQLTLDRFVTNYRLREKIRCTQAAKLLLKTPLETERIWYSYLGGLFLRNGISVTKAFVTQLIDPEASVQQSNDAPSPTPHQGSPMPSISQGSQQHPNFSGQYLNQAFISGYSTYTNPPPPPPTAVPPPLPSSPSHVTPGGIPPSQVTLALMNQTAVQKRYQVTYTQQTHGPPHMPTWYCVCYLNGQEKGQGQGKNLKQAKEQAAQMAWAAMGW